MQKFSIGLSMTISYEEYMLLFEKYSSIIDYIYFSIPGDEYQTRHDIFKGFSTVNATNALKKCLNLASSYGIKTELALNTYLLTERHIRHAYNYCAEQLQVTPDAIVSIISYGEFIHEVFGETYQIVSFNSSIKNIEDINRIPSIYSEVVFGGSSIRNIELWKYAKTSGFKPRLLLNNGCSFNCGSCKSAKTCKEVFQRNLDHFGINRLYALQSIVPSEFHDHIVDNGFLCGYKISNRNCTYEYLDSCLNSYIENNEENLKYGQRFYLWCRLSHFCKFYPYIDFAKVKMIKDRIWGR